MWWNQRRKETWSSTKTKAWAKTSGKIYYLVKIKNTGEKYKLAEQDKSNKEKKSEACWSKKPDCWRKVTNYLKDKELKLNAAFKQEKL
nr:hypothetical protein [Mycoplasmopsis bovis]